MITEQELWNKLYDDDEFEYVRYIAFQYYSEYLEEPMVIPADLPPIEEIGHVSDEPEKLTCIGIRHEGFTPFRDIQTGKITFLFNREDYDRNEVIQQTLTLIGLDKDKFWHALLYIHYLAERWNKRCVPLKPSVHDEVYDLIQALREEKTTVTIKRKGKKAYAITNHLTRECLAVFLEYGDSKYSHVNNPTYSGRTLLHMENALDQNWKWQIFDEYNAFMELFKKYCTDGALPSRVKRQKGYRDKDLFVSRLLYFSGLVTDYSYWLMRDRLHAIKCYCQANQRPLMTSGLL